jgi:CheY-like chemotaxis protein
MTPRRVLCVDDDPRLLESVSNHLALEYDVVCAEGGAAALACLAAAPCEVILSDMRMPGMSGAEFLTAARTVAPRAVRMLLTGQADLRDAAEVIRQGGLFRLLLKPCPTEALLANVADAFRQYDLEQAEREVLEQTLHGAVELLSDILGVVQPLAFGRATRLVAIVKDGVAALGLEGGWQVELAAMMSQLGCLTFDAGLIARAHANRLAPSERVMYEAHPKTARKLIEHLPRLGLVAELVGDQYACTTTHATATGQVGCGLLRAAIAVIDAQDRTKSYAAAVEEVARKLRLDASLVAALRAHRASGERRVVRVQGRELVEGMQLECDAVSPRGELWIQRGTILTETAAQRLRALAERSLLGEPLLVAVAS